MPKPTIVDAPAYLTATKAIEYAKKIVNEYRSGSITTAALAHTMSHENDKSGTFLRKLADLKRYGIIEGRGSSLYATDLAKRIAAWTSEEERNNALREMVFNIPIFKQLYEAFQSNRAPSDSEVLSQLLNITKKDRAELQSISADIRRLYIDAVQYISMQTAQTKVQTELAPKMENIPAQLSDNVVSMSDEGVSISIKKDFEHLQLAKEFIELYLNKLKNKRGGN